MKSSERGFSIQGQYMMCVWVLCVFVFSLLSVFICGVTLLSFVYDLLVSVCGVCLLCVVIRVSCVCLLCGVSLCCIYLLSVYVNGVNFMFYVYCVLYLCVFACVVNLF
jgi:hypothetical protein